MLKKYFLLKLLKRMNLQQFSSALKMVTSRKNNVIFINKNFVVLNND